MTDWRRIHNRQKPFVPHGRTPIKAAEGIDLVYRIFKTKIPATYEPSIAVDGYHGRDTETEQNIQ